MIHTPSGFDVHSYDKIIIAFSGGKDSIACFLYMVFVLGVPLSKIEIHHHEIDGRGETFMDWEVTSDYCRKFAEAFGVPIYFSWKEGGFLREMSKTEARTAPIAFECPDGQIRTTGGKFGKISTRQKFPQISSDLTTRWCSAYLKIDVCKAVIRNQDRFRGIRTLVVSGERAEESLSPEQFKEHLADVQAGGQGIDRGRAGYNVFEPDAADLRDGKRYQRHVDRLRPLRDWSERQVWDLIQEHQVVVHPCYYLGWSRCSCKFCIFGNADQFASGFYISPGQANKLVEKEIDYNTTLKRDTDLISLIRKGNVYESITDDLVDLATSYQYTGQIFTDTWILPSGAFGEGCGAN